MSCKRFDQEWEVWLGGQASRDFLEHLGRCRACAEQARELEQTHEWLTPLRQEPPLPPPAFWARLVERLEAEDRGADFWTALNWVAARATLALVVLVLLMTLGALLEPAPAAVADFDAPQPYFEENRGVVLANGQLNRDQVVLTLVAYQEPQR